MVECPRTPWMTSRWREWWISHHKICGILGCFGVFAQTWGNSPIVWFAVLRMCQATWAQWVECAHGGLRELEFDMWVFPRDVSTHHEPTQRGTHNDVFRWAVNVKECRLEGSVIDAFNKARPHEVDDNAHWWNQVIHAMTEVANGS